MFKIDCAGSSTDNADYAEENPNEKLETRNQKPETFYSTELVTVTPHCYSHFSFKALTYGYADHHR
jgi:hypothetical protein